MSRLPGVASLKAEFGGHASTLARDIIITTGLGAFPIRS
jgi:hypothetical protein